MKYLALRRKKAQSRLPENSRITSRTVLISLYHSRAVIQIESGPLQEVLKPPIAISMQHLRPLCNKGKYKPKKPWPSIQNRTPAQKDKKLRLRVLRKPSSYFNNRHATLVIRFCNRVNQIYHHGGPRESRVAPRYYFLLNIVYVLCMFNRCGRSTRGRTVHF